MAEPSGFNPNNKEPGVTKTVLACPNCRGTETLATIERIYGLADASCIQPGDENWAVEISWDGYTRMIWDSSKTVGIHCNGIGCEFDYEDADWEQVLIKVEVPA